MNAYKSHDKMELPRMITPPEAENINLNYVQRIMVLQNAWNSEERRDKEVDKS